MLVAPEVLTNRGAVAFYGLHLILVKELVEGSHLNYVLLKFLFIGGDHFNKFVQKFVHPFCNHHEFIYLESSLVNLVFCEPTLDVEVGVHGLK